jgi:hypothetical protein
MEPENFSQKAAMTNSVQNQKQKSGNGSPIAKTEF